MMNVWRRLVAVVLVGAFIVGLVACDKPQARVDKSVNLTSFNSYEELYDYLEEVSEKSNIAIDLTNGTVSNMNMQASADMESAKAADYSQTNVQVEGIDEGDVVKTDGEYIYVLKNKEIVIIAADGADSAEVARLEAVKEADDMTEYVREFYVSEGKLAVITVQNRYKYNENGDLYERIRAFRAVESRTAVKIYDVQDMADITLLGETAQEGYFISSRAKDGLVYILSNDNSALFKEKTNLASYVPQVYENGEGRSIAINDICALPEKKGLEYTIVSAVNLADGQIVATEAVLGGYGTVYMSEDNLYLAYREYDTTEKTQLIDGKQVTDYADESRTKLVRIGLAELEAQAAGDIEGYLVNQFAMDEYEGYLRVAATIDKYSYRTYQSPKGYTNYEPLEDQTSNALYILDSDLNIVSEIENLTEGERVYSVRFAEDVGYIVTFRQVDPLFSLDLSDPLQPKVMGELKIPGFSEYLHLYSEDRLFGLGLSADEDTGRTGALKLSMFDTSDPYNVTEKHTLELKDDFSAAEYNHKAILVAPQKDIIAFPVKNSYEVYGYSDEAGFLQKARIDLEDWSGNARGLYIDGYFYIVNSNKLFVCNLDDFTLVLNREIEGDNGPAVEICKSGAFCV